MDNWVKKIQNDGDLGNIAKTVGRIIAEKYSSSSELIAKFYFNDLARELNTAPDIVRVGIFQLLSSGYLKQDAGAAGRPIYAMRFPVPEAVEIDEDAVA
jgi:hypothetical protein